MRKFLLLTVLLVIGHCGLTFAQDKVVTGKVTDGKDGSPLPGVSIAVKGTTKGTTSDGAGVFKVNAADNAVLIISFVGYSTQEIKIGNRSVVNASLFENVNQLSEVVVTGLATSVKRSNLANAVATISGSQLTGTTSPITTDGALYGKMTGVNIQSNSSVPGGGFSMQMRGVSTLGASAAQPLFIVDGVYIDNSQFSNGRSQANKATGGSSSSPQDNNANRLADLNPDDIENIEVLKGASAAAIYGTRANAGVVIITTKRGKGGKTKISFGQDLGYSEAWRFYGGADWTAEKLTNYFSAADVPLLEAAKASGKYYNYEKEIYGGKGIIRNSRLSLTGGDDKTKFYVNGSLSDETGIIKNTGFTRASVRANIDHKITKWLDFGISTNYIFSNNDRGWTGNDNSNVNYGYSLAYTRPYINLYPDANGNYPDNQASVGENPLAIRDRAVNNQKVNRLLQGFNVNLRLLNRESTSLTVKFNGGLDYQNGFATIYLPSDLQSQRAEANPGFAQDTRTEVTNTNWQVAGVFTKSLMNSKLNLTTSAGVVSLSKDVRLTYTRGTGLPAGISNPGAAKVVSSIPEYQKNKDIGIFAQQEVNFNDQVIVAGGIRFDKSTLNGEFDKYYAFPRGSVAVNVSKFDFFKVDAINQLKFRLAYGETGGVPNWGIPFNQLLTVGTGGQGGLVLSTTGGNAKIKPETATELEGGLDFGLFNNRVTGEFTLYKKKVFDLIQPLTLAPTTGLTSIQTNLADLENVGMEISLGADIIRRENFTWFFRPMYWYNRSKITRLEIPERLTGGFGATFGQWRVKGPLNGVYYSPTEIVGQPRTDPADPTSWTSYGDQQPKFEMSFDNKITFLKNFEFSALFHWKKDYTIVSLSRVLWDEGGNTSDWNSTSLGLGSDGKPATGSNVVPNGIARQNVNGVGKEGYNPSLVSYLRLREVALYYRIPKATIKKAFAGVVENIKVGVSGNNVITWTNYKAGYDPESSNFGSQALGGGVDLGSSPGIRRMMFHITVDF
jgi:TonB-linked SusC/RagA family outer membrane protein